VRSRYFRTVNAATYVLPFPCFLIHSFTRSRRREKEPTRCHPRRGCNPAPQGSSLKVTVVGRVRRAYGLILGAVATVVYPERAVDESDVQEQEFLRHRLVLLLEPLSRTASVGRIEGRL
jgi:hypothetical protein